MGIQKLCKTPLNRELPGCPNDDPTLENISFDYHKCYSILSLLQSNYDPKRRINERFLIEVAVSDPGRRCHRRPTT